MLLDQHVRLCTPVQQQAKTPMIEIKAHPRWLYLGNWVTIQMIINAGKKQIY